MYGPQLLPMTGCNLGLLLGLSAESWVITVASLALIGNVFLSWYRLRRGEQHLK